MPDSDATPRKIADAHTRAYVELDPITGTEYGLAAGDDRIPDFSPEWHEARAALLRTTLGELARAPVDDDAERRCARLLDERLNAELAVIEADEGLRQVSNLFSPVHAVREALTLMPTGTEDDWAVIARRLARVPKALEGYRASLTEGLRRGLPAGPRQVSAVIDQLGGWLDGGSGRSWFTDFATPGPDVLRRDLDAGADAAAEAVAGLRTWLRTVYGPGVVDAPDPVGRERYLRWARFWNGIDLDPEEAYAYGWSEMHRIGAEMREAAGAILPGATPLEAMAHLEGRGEAVEGTEGILSWLQGLMDEAVERLDGSHFDLDPRIRTAEAHIAPPGTAPVPYYTPPALDFSRPGRTWLPARPGQSRFPTWDLVSVWYHEGVPGHHLQLAQWVLKADRLSTYQATLGRVSANCEGWALYAERLMDELGHLTDPGYRLGYLNGQMLRAVRVIIDLGMHLSLTIPRDSGFHPGERWTPRLGREFLAARTGLPAATLDSEHIRYLGMPGQAIGYKLGERVWLAGRETAKQAHGPAFDLKTWHMAALSQGSLGLDDLAAELAAL
ncbi:DUF885 domain-containing protein [Streptomyces sp. NPDC003247]|uniref:DUF885 domain-containing protein n=1 Tax=Streptomyces sp. NPDC003247 TaxID=3364677 RepID=UPI00368A11D8